MDLARKWMAIAKAEFMVQTSRLRRWRKGISLLLLLFGVVWALYIIPTIMSNLLAELGTTVELVFMASFPSLMRSAMLFLWIVLLVYPISYALQEIRIGQWEIMLSNNVSTRDMMFGMFMGKVPSYGLLVLFAAPIMLSPFALLFEVSLLGQTIMYLVVYFVAVGTLFLSTLITTAIQAKLGDSPRGNDIAKALAMVVAVVIVGPMYGLIYFADSMSAVLGMDVFLLFPFTWGADVISWTVIVFNGVGITASAFLSILRLDALTSLLLLVLFTVGSVGLADRSADRIFSFGAGPRTEKITTVGEENRILKNIRRIWPGSFGVMVVTSIKEFSRKMQNVSRLAYGVVLSVLLPVILNASIGSIGEEAPAEVRGIITLMTFLMLGFMLAMLAGITFGGIGFLESKSQLWIIMSAPRGAWKFAKARITQSLLLSIPLAIIPSVPVVVLFGFGVAEFLALVAFTWWTISGAVLLSTGVTANNPAYEDQKSTAFYVNTFASIVLIMIVMILSLFPAISLMTIYASLPLFLIILSTPLVLVGIGVFFIGIGRMSRAEIA
ncbi:MAG: hypothetical protein JSW61_09205 [Candidatus Thorarchaeota archaeon]|nr:MAG: hypothetical protein JSW61_09205 [Candidatus Thorarchaeota archaeon]